MTLKYKLTFYDVDDRQEWVTMFREYLTGYRGWREATTIYTKGTVVYIHLAEAYCCVYNKIESVSGWSPRLIRWAWIDASRAKHPKTRIRLWDRYNQASERHRVILKKY